MVNLYLRYYVCDYGPGGNLIGDVMYQPGPQCSRCPTGSSCTSRYSGLCSGDTLSFIDNNYIDDFSSRCLSNIAITCI